MAGIALLASILHITKSFLYVFIALHNMLRNLRILLIILGQVPIMLLVVTKFGLAGIPF